MPTPAGCRIWDVRCGSRVEWGGTYGSSGYHVARLECLTFGKRLDEEGDGEDQVFGGGVLAWLAVHDGLKTQDFGEVLGWLCDGALDGC